MTEAGSAGPAVASTAPNQAARATSASCPPGAPARCRPTMTRRLTPARCIMPDGMPSGDDPGPARASRSGDLRVQAGPVRAPAHPTSGLAEPSGPWPMPAASGCQTILVGLDGSQPPLAGPRKDCIFANGIPTGGSALENENGIRAFWLGRGPLAALPAAPGYPRIPPRGTPTFQQRLSSYRPKDSLR